jgi:hypothetical protein
MSVRANNEVIPLIDPLGAFISLVEDVVDCDLMPLWAYSAGGK